jgi:hypothetical protein
VRFERIKQDNVSFHDQRLMDNSFDAHVSTTRSFLGCDC